MATVPKPTTSHDEQLVRALAKEWQQHYNARDLDKLLSLYTPDASSLPPFYPIANGATAIRQYLVDVLQENDPRNLTVETYHVEVSGDTAFGIGTFQENAKMPTGERMDVPGKWTVVLHRIGSDWKIFVHCWNTDLAVGAMTT